MTVRVCSLCVRVPTLVTGSFNVSLCACILVLPLIYRGVVFYLYMDIEKYLWLKCSLPWRHPPVCEFVVVCGVHVGEEEMEVEAIINDLILGNDLTRSDRSGRLDITMYYQLIDFSCWGGQACVCMCVCRCWGRGEGFPMENCNYSCLM